jgi:hypothetical protein
MNSTSPKKGRPATKATKHTGSNNKNNKPTATHREVTPPNKGAGAANTTTPHGTVPKTVTTTTPIPRKKSKQTNTETPEDPASPANASPHSITSVNYLEEAPSDDDDNGSQQLYSQPSLSESIYTKPPVSSLLSLFEKEVTPPSTKITSSRASKTTNTSSNNVPAAATATAKAAATAAAAAAVAAAVATAAAKTAAKAAAKAAVTAATLAAARAKARAAAKATAKATATANAKAEAKRAATAAAKVAATIAATKAAATTATQAKAKHKTDEPSTNAADAAAAKAAAEATIETELNTTLAHDDITSSQEEALMQGAAEYDKYKLEQQATTLASTSTMDETLANDSTVSNKATSLPHPFKTAANAKAEAAAQDAADALHALTEETTIREDNVTTKEATAAKAKAKPTANETMIVAHERKLKQREKVWAKADAAVDTDTFIQATTEAFGAHTTSKLITNAIADLTRKLHKLTLVVSDYQAKASKFKDLPTWMPRSCRSGFTLSAPKGISDDDPGLEAIRENVAVIQNTYETALRQCVQKRELLLLKKALHQRRELFVSDSLDIATNWLCLWLPKNQKLLRRDPLTINEDQVVGIIFERLLTMGCFELRKDLNLFFNEDLSFHFMLAAKLRGQPRFRSPEVPEKRIFRNRQEADATGMYPFTKVTWDHDEYHTLETAIRIIEKPLTTFLMLLCKETTFKFQQEYEDELNYKLAELQVEARMKRAAALSAAAATATALENAHKAAPESVRKTIDKLQNKMTQLQRTQQNQKHKDKGKPTVKFTAHTANKPKQKNMHGGRDKRLSAAPKATNNDNRRGKANSRPLNSRQRPTKRKATETSPTDQSTLSSTSQPKRPRQQQQQPRQPRQKKQRRQQKRKATNANEPPDASNNVEQGTATVEN